MAKTTATSSENSIIVRTTIISSLILAGLFAVFFFLENSLEKLFGKYADEVVIGLMLLSLWLVIGSGIRSINSLCKGIPSWKLLLAGVSTAAVGALLYLGFLFLFPKVSKSGLPTEIVDASGKMIFLLIALAFVISLLAVINVRVKNKALGNVLEFLIIGGCIFGFVYFVVK